MNEELEALTILSATPHLGAVKISLLLETFGSAKEILSLKPKQLLPLKGFGPKISASWGWWQNSDSWKKNLATAEKEGVELIPFTSKRYPPLLKEITDPPVVLYVKGKLPKEPTVAVVGSRSASTQGLKLAKEVAKELVEGGVTVVSGLARGVDTQAHRATVEENGKTVAVIGSGLGHLYPKENSALADLIAKKGAVVSEYPMLTPPERKNFPQRNRIISGLSLGTVLVQSPEKGGAMLAMQRAKSQRRYTFALRGDAKSYEWMGNRALIQSGDARPVDSGKEVVAAILGLDDEEQRLLKALPNEEVTIEHIGLLTKLPIRKLHVLLMSLLLKQTVKKYPGNMYKKLICKELS